ncbi:unnamed protein product [Boreogadus saida]
MPQDPVLLDPPAPWRAPPGCPGGHTRVPGGGRSVFREEMKGGGAKLALFDSCILATPGTSDTSRSAKTGLHWWTRHIISHQAPPQPQQGERKCARST